MNNYRKQAREKNHNTNRGFPDSISLSLFFLSLRFEKAEKGTVGKNMECFQLEPIQL